MKTKNIFRFLKKIAEMLNLVEHTTVREQFNQFAEDQKHEMLLKRIKEIRTNSSFVPDYDRQKEYHVKLTCERVLDFGGDIAKWKQTVQEEDKKSISDKREREIVYRETMEQRYKIYNQTINKFLTVN